jgi:hypothetical protein
MKRVMSGGESLHVLGLEKTALPNMPKYLRQSALTALITNSTKKNYLLDLASAVPEDFLFGFKVTDEVTVKTYANLPRYITKAGRPNANFLNADLFIHRYLAPCEGIRKNVGLLISIGTDAHHPSQLEFIDLGLAAALAA